MIGLVRQIATITKLPVIKIDIYINSGVVIAEKCSSNKTPRQRVVNNQEIGKFKLRIYWYTYLIYKIIPTSMLVE